MNPIKLEIAGGDDMMMGPSFGPVIGTVIAEVAEGFDGMLGPFVLLETDEPVIFDGELVEFLVLSPRHEGDNSETIRTKSCVVWFARVLPGMIEDAKRTINTKNVQTIAIGGSKPVPNA